MKKLFLGLAVVALTAFGLTGVLAMPTYAKGVVCPDGHTEESGDIKDCYKAGAGGNTGITTGVDDSLTTKNLNGTLNTIINVIIGIVGFVAVVMMVMGGISFITSQGDTAKVTKARNTILYGVVGLVVALLAFAIVNFVLSNVFGSASSVWL